MFTTLFGFYAGKTFVNSRNLLVPAALHSQCNIIGFPEIFNVFSPDISVQKRVGKCRVAIDITFSLFWLLIVIGAVYVTGVFVFFSSFDYLTLS